MTGTPPHEPPSVEVPHGAWFGDGTARLDFPPGWRVHRLDPDDAPELDDAAIERAFAEPLGTRRLRELCRGRRSAAIAVDDLTRPTPAARILPVLLRELEAGGIAGDAVRIVMGTAAHRPMTRDEVERKLGPEVARSVPVVMHDFLGPDLRDLGWHRGGPVHLNRHFVDADLRICVGAAVPHNETGFGGGAKMLVPGLAGRRTIAHFHGALPPRPAGRLEARGTQLDRRAWSESVARHVGVQAVVCAAVNSRARLAALAVGDLVDAHRAAARAALRIGRTPVPAGLARRADAVVVNAFPLDTDPIQMGKSILAARHFPGAIPVCVNAASDGIFYHGMGMGSGVSPHRLLANLPRWLASPADWGAWLRGLAVAAPAPALAARFSYFALNHLAWDAFVAGEGQRPPGEAEAAAGGGGGGDGPLVWSERFPAWGFRRRYPRGRLCREWGTVRDALARRRAAGEAAVLPCAPLQILEEEA